MMDCSDAQLHLLDYQRGRLAADLRGEIRTHLEGCPACRDEEVAERELTTLLDRRPRYPASGDLKRRLAAGWTPAPAAAASPRAGWRRWATSLAPALATAAVLLIATSLYYGQQRAADEVAGLVGEAVNDHLRVLSGRRPLEVESSAIHQVKPWFQGRLDFAPVVPFAGDEAFPLQGGAIEYFLDRQAAVFVYKRRLHTVSLFVFRAEGLPWPGRGLEPLGPVPAYRTTARGFHVVLWRAGELGYALVSDLEASELRDLAARLAAAG